MTYLFQVLEKSLSPMTQVAISLVQVILECPSYLNVTFQVTFLFLETLTMVLLEVQICPLQYALVIFPFLQALVTSLFQMILVTCLFHEVPVTFLFLSGPMVFLETSIFHDLLTYLSLRVLVMTYPFEEIQVIFPFPEDLETFSFLEI